jgi:AraC-like DNA-binding protein
VKIYVKYMVSLRCKMLVKEELQNLGIGYKTIDLGVVDLTCDITTSQLDQIKETLKRSGLEVIDDKKTILIERIKNLIIEMVHYSDELPKVNCSDFISEQMQYDYTYLSNIFSEVKGITIQQFIIINKIERAKELLLYDELNLSEIADKLHYSSVAHLSSQFKKVTGLTPSFFKHLSRKRRFNINDL